MNAITNLVCDAPLAPEAVFFYALPLFALALVALRGMLDRNSTPEQSYGSGLFAFVCVLLGFCVLIAGLSYT